MAAQQAYSDVVCLFQHDALLSLFTPYRGAYVRECINLLSSFVGERG